MAKKAKAYIAMAATFILLVILIWIGPLDGWKFWPVLLAIVPFSLWACAAIFRWD